MIKRDTDGIVELTEAEYEVMESGLGLACEALQHVEDALLVPLRDLVKECSAAGGEQSVAGDKIAKVLEDFDRGDFKE